MIQEEIDQLAIDIKDAMLSGDYEKIVTILELIIKHINDLEK
jgi:hypothetical protein